MKVIITQDKTSYSLSLNKGNLSCYMNTFFDEFEDTDFTRSLLKYLDNLKFKTFELVLYIDKQLIMINNVMLDILIVRYKEWKNKSGNKSDNFKVFINNILQLKIK
jgi:hypothetical protein